MSANQTPIDIGVDAVVAVLGGSRRDGQHEMANAVADAMVSSEHLLVQAGTGTGKSLAYLVPAILRAGKGVNSDGDNRTVIATATLALQHQLVDEDLPRAVTALASMCDRPVSFAVLKGRHNYVCLDKFNRDATVASQEDDNVLFDAPTSRIGRQAKKLREWIATTDTGDRDDYPHELDSKLWRSVAVSGRECIGATKCAWGQKCFAEKARADANASSIVVTNHALLVIDLIEGIPILPEYDTVVIDEAHELIDRTTNALAGSLDVNAVERAARLVRKFVPPATFERLIDEADLLGQALSNVETFGAITRLEEAVGTLHRTLTGLRDVCKVALSEISASSQDEPDVAAAKKRGKADLQEIFNHAAAFLTPNDQTVLWLNSERTLTLHYAPLTVSGYLKDALFGRSTVILTSATLSVAGTMDAMAAGLGLGDDSSWKTLDVGSPFDYERQGILYCAAHLPAPSSDGMPPEGLDELAELIDAAGGRTLALFSSWRGVERAADYLSVRFRDREDRPIIVAQRGDAIAELVRKFRSEPRASLLGTVSLWQGIDVPGDTCTLVTIDRLPFPRPDDPVMSARAARVDAAGGNGFTSVQVPRAALLLAQGVGRLIRSTQDRGVVAILDSRLATKGYGSTLRKSVPPLWYSTDKEQVMNSLRNLDSGS